MPRFIVRTALFIYLACQALVAQALVVLPVECELAGVDPSCIGSSEPHGSEIGLLVGNAIVDKLIASEPQLALPILESGFLHEWSQAWTSFPVPTAVESIIVALNGDEFEQWINWLCFNLQPDTTTLPIIDFSQVPALVVGSMQLTVDSTTVPLPAAAWLFASAVAGLAIGGKHRKQ
ncbi:MAG: hypothetical protein HKO71_06000 [Pseudomonadales bacterium]|nr:hypothetical protein [Pseudomonadales bacterium]